MRTRSQLKDMKWTKRCPVPAVLLGLVMASTTAYAGLVGTTVTLDYHAPNRTTTDVFTVTGGVDITCPGPYNVCSLLTAPVQTIAVGENTITYTFTGCCSAFEPTPPNYFDFENLNLGSPITSVTLSTNLAGLDLTRLSFTNDSVQLHMQGIQTPGPVDYFVLTLNPAATPEPSSLALLGSGSLGLFVVARRRLKL